MKSFVRILSPSLQKGMTIDYDREPGLGHIKPGSHRPERLGGIRHEVVQDRLMPEGQLLHLC